jgi:hypothetical protein
MTEKGVCVHCGQPAEMCIDCGILASAVAEMMRAEFLRAVEKCINVAQSVKIPHDEYDDAGWWNAQEQIVAALLTMANGEK